MLLKTQSALLRYIVQIAYMTGRLPRKPLKLQIIQKNTKKNMYERIEAGQIYCRAIVISEQVLLLLIVKYYNDKIVF